jgi:2-C-methyl-D-erythritol 4-phosphate cytidylyltransferase
MVEKKKFSPKKKLRIAAIILAGGSGERMGGSYKQFTRINGKPIIFYSIEVFLKCPFVNEIIVAVPKGKVMFAENLIYKKYPKGKIRVIEGGKARRYSAYNALKYIRDGKRRCDYIILHDGVRPLLSVGMTRAVVRKAIKYGAAVLGSKVLNVVVEVKKGTIAKALNPKYIYNTQTPHCYRLDIILEAHESKKNRGKKFDLLENIELVSAIGKKIVLVDEYYRNMKLTYRQDVIALEAYLKKCGSGNFFDLK